MTGILEAIGLALLWAFVTGELSVRNMAAGFVLGYVVLIFAGRAPSFSAGRVPGFGHLTIGRVWKAISLFFYFLWELVVANLSVARVVVSPRLPIKPGVVAVPLDVRTDAEITLLANLITLTPGTMSVEVSDDRRVLYVHAIDVGDRDGLVSSIKQGFERRVMEVLR